MPQKLYTRTKVGLTLIFLLTGFIIFSHSAIGQRLNLSPDLVEALKSFLASDMQINACDYQDGMILLVKPVATGQAGDNGRYEAGDIIEIRDGATLCANFGNKSPFGKSELTKLLPLYYPHKLTNEQITELTELEMNYESESQNPEQTGEVLKMRKVGVDYTAILDQSEITKKANLKNINRIPTIDLNLIKTKTAEQKAVISLSDYTPPKPTTWQKFVDIMRPTAYALTNPVVTVDTGGTGDYSSLNAAIAGEQRDLTSTDEQITFDCQATSDLADTTAATVDGFTTDETRYVKVWTDPAGSDRHIGIWDNTKYRIVTNVSSNLTISDPYTLVEGIQSENTRTSYGYTYALTVTTNYCTVKSVLAINVVISNAASQGIRNEGSYNTFENTYAQGYQYGFWQTSAANPGNKYLHCVAYSSAGGYAFFATYHANPASPKNEIYHCVGIEASGNDAFSNGLSNSYWSTFDYNAANDANAPGTHKIQLTGNPFVDWANRDYRVQSGVNYGSEIIDKGGVSGVGVEEDVIGTARPQNTYYDVGWYEYIPSATTKSPNEKGLVGWWKFDEGTSTKALDYSNNKNTGTITGATWANGKLGKALSFDGTDDYVAYSSNDVPNSFFTSGFTISAWIKPNSIGETQGRIVDRTTTTGINDGFAYRVSGTDDRLQLSVAGGTSIYSDIGSITFGEWQHVLVTVASNALVTHYINGVVSGTPGLTSSLSGIDTTNYLCIGNRGGVSTCNTDRSFDGLIDDVRIYNYALTAEEVKEIYKAGETRVKAPNEKGLVGWWKFDEGAGTKALDYSNNKNTGTIYNADWSEGKLGKSLEFSGSPDYVDVGTNLDQNGEMTITAWIKPSSITATNRDIVSNSDGLTDKDYKLQINRTGSLGKISAIWASTVVVTNNTAMSPGNWYHVAMVRSGATGNWTVNMYLNGQDDGSGTTSNNPNGNNEVTAIGRDGAGNQEYFPGKIDDVRIYNRALSAEEVKGLYQMGETRIRK